MPPKGGDWMNNYRISEFTLAIVPHGNNESICYEIDDKIIVKKKTNFIISKNCINFGSSMSGRKDFTEHLTGYIYKAPILVHEEKKLIFFPTSSTRNKDCSWINLDNIDYTFYDEEKRTTKIVFINGLVLDFNISLNIINNQIYRATRLEHNLKKIYR